MSIDTEMPKDLLPEQGSQREALLGAIEAHLKAFKCYLMVDPHDDECWHVVDVIDGRGDIAEIRDLLAFARINGIAVPR